MPEESELAPDKPIQSGAAKLSRRPERYVASINGTIDIHNRHREDIPCTQRSRSLPDYVQREFADWLKCGRLKHRYLRLLVY